MRKVAVVGLLGWSVSLALVQAQAPRLEPSKAPLPSVTTVDFVRDIQPILSKHCIACHGPRKAQGGLRLDHPDLAFRGGNSGPVIVPGKSRESRLVRVVDGSDPELKMPEGGRPLSAEEIAKLRTWIDQGASWPKPESGPVALRSDHWAYQPIRRPPVPLVKNSAWVRNPIDAFVLARLEQEGIQPAPEADKLTLLRRVSLDLTGLPPTLDEIEAYLGDTRPDAYERAVERLLNSPHYGERWARHWLDLARYADTDGYEKDLGRPWAWRWRNWVIAALNEDKPFDQFVIEQLAGDLLPNATIEQKVATGFHRNTLTNREGGVDQEQFRVEAVVDRVNTTFAVFFGTTMNCCQCHDHKYDPFTQREFYQLFAFFNSDDEVDIPAPLPGEEEVVLPKITEHERQRQQLVQAIEKRRQELREQLPNWEAKLTESERAKLPAPVQAVLNIPAASRKPDQLKVLLDHLAHSDAMLSELNRKLQAHDRAKPTLTHAQTLRLGPLRKTHVLIRGDFLRPGAEVQPGTPAVLHPFRPRHNPPNRLDLAEWIVDPANPLTPRVTVNWIWQRYFGRGIVATVNDFGTQGEKPSHPELLDWLASEFVRQGWSLKKLHRLIVTSATYRQSSAYRPELEQRDPYNTLLARQNRLRLEAEVIRDNALAVSGLLVRRIGGPSVRPPQPPGISELTYAGSARWIESTGPDRYRRGLYIWFQRTSPYPTLVMFDAPDSNTCCMKRERSNTPLQSLTLLNDVVFVECAQALGKRLAESPGDLRQRIRLAFRTALTREPTVAELSRLELLWHELHTEAQHNVKQAEGLLGSYMPERVPIPEAVAWVGLARVLLNLDEFITRE
ncbi:MAG: PSD1 and planctomycete cytochrome C domain-containing protein [Gemmatales bacterium]|nr:PSD1 and planctomycete cytochrome C domain-containing protein [Gemmatales bacterium]